MALCGIFFGFADGSRWHIADGAMEDLQQFWGTSLESLIASRESCLQSDVQRGQSGARENPRQARAQRAAS
jgi:hypothetical protein